jgi:hypothetical protein
MVPPNKEFSRTPGDTGGASTFASAGYLALGTRSTVLQRREEN